MAFNVEDDKWEKLFAYWDELEVVKTLEPDEFKVVAGHPIRDAMVYILRKGIDDAGRIRHVLSLKEMLPLVNKYLQSKNLGGEVKMTALYYHRDLLEEKGIITEVAQFLEGKRYVSYYGRTAKGFVSKNSYDEIGDDFNILLADMVGEITDEKNREKFVDLLSQHKKNTLELDLVIKKWIEDHTEAINKIDIDIITLYSYMRNFLGVHPLVSDLNTEIGRILGFNV